MSGRNSKGSTPAALNLAPAAPAVETGRCGRRNLWGGRGGPPDYSPPSATSPHGPVRRGRSDARAAAVLRIVTSWPCRHCASRYRGRHECRSAGTATTGIGNRRLTIRQCWRRRRATNLHGARRMRLPRRHVHSGRSQQSYRLGQPARLRRPVQPQELCGQIGITPLQRLQQGFLGGVGKVLLHARGP
jgi:hypothetical protein